MNCYHESSVGPLPSCTGVVTTRYSAEGAAMSPPLKCCLHMLAVGIEGGSCAVFQVVLLPLQDSAEQGGGRGASAQCSTSQAPVQQNQSEQHLSVTLHVLRGYVAVRVHMLHAENCTGNKMQEDDCIGASNPVAAAPPLTLPQLQYQLAAGVHIAEQRHQERCSQVSAAPDLNTSSSAISIAISLMSLLARALLARSSHGVQPAAPQQHKLLSLGLNLPTETCSMLPANAGAREDSTDRSSFSERAPMPHTPNMAAYVPPFSPLHVVTDSQPVAAAGATSPDHSKQPLSALSSMHDPAAPLHPAEKLPCIGVTAKDVEGNEPGVDSAACRKIADEKLSPFAHHGAASTGLSRDSSLLSPRDTAAFNLVSQGSGCTLATEDSGALEDKECATAASCTAWPADVGVSPAEWLAALTIAPYLPQILLHRLDAFTCQHVRVHKNLQLAVYDMSKTVH